MSLATFSLSGRRGRLDRQRQAFAEAFEAVMEYREYPFIVRRRNPDEAAEERLGRCYSDLVKQTRDVAGAMIKAAWDNPPVTEDEDMHAPAYDFSALDEYENRYLQAVAQQLSWFPWWVRRSDAKVAAEGSKQ